MKRSYQQSISFIMTAIYLLITLSPLASIGSRSNPFLNIIPRECSGDCRLCGCSVERSAAHACCCWQKKLAGAKALQQPLEQKSCPTASSAADTKTAGNCCSKAAEHDGHEDQASTLTPAENSTDRVAQTVSISTCPCGSGKDLTFFGNEKTQHIPFRFLAGIPLQLVTPLSSLQPERLTTRYGEPPDPPPKLSVIS